jgi:hypothetical protein
MRIASLFLLAAACAGPAHSAPLSRELGHGLAYVRVHSLPGDLPAVMGEACVLDLRYVAGGRAAAAPLGSWVRAHCGRRTPVLILANARTGPDLLAGLVPRDAIPGLVILGAPAPGFQPDVAVSVAPGTERRAYDALEKGVPVDSLVTEAVDKPRDDEAMLAREHLPDSALGDEGGPAAGDEAGRAATPPQLVDAVLQRAVQLHRALVALGRL